MTTIRQVKQLVAPLIERNPDLTLVGRLMFVKPLRHVIRGIFIDRSGSAKLFVPYWVAIFLFEHRDSMTLSWSERIRPSEKGLWDISNPEMLPALRKRIEEVALPIVRSIETLDDFKAVIAKHIPGQAVDLYPYR